MRSYIILIIANTIGLSVTPALAQSGKRWGSGVDFTQRAANREKGRWSLTEWMEMKNKNRIMDMWLSMNSPSPFEFSLAGFYSSHKTETKDSGVGSSYNSFSGEFSAYAQLVGLTAEYENNTEENYHDLSGMLNIRLLGNSIQNTAFTISLGQRTRDSSGNTPNRFDQQFAQGALQLYLTKYFGLDGKYRHFLTTTTDALGSVDGNIATAGLFLDFNAIRIFGEWYKENQKSKLPAAASDTVIDRVGIRSGIKIFF